MQMSRYPSGAGWGCAAEIDAGWGYRSVTRARGPESVRDHQRYLSALRTRLQRSRTAALGAFLATVSGECGKDAKRPERNVYASDRDIDHQADPFPGGRPVTTSMPGNDPDDGD